ncbi:ORF6N domain-containing protein [Pectobacterium aquaticum]|uniref:ORF6N domain-containing protein n=1 Tax=Pectobacterium aquaticum TaxID=2204145 RepID=A0A3R8PCK0_9GAMM|nr:ORF6N domain-containing protein [Pectobacterium aquaticum]RRO01872.1 ORF6N domain-containing protein [Pectobacterium aquaticum]
MTTQLSVESLSVVLYSNAPVITTELLANVYNTQPDYIRKNYSRNADRFVAGKHYFLLEGDTLREFKHSVSLRPSVKVSRNARSLILWTERGAARHAKMLETDQAWDVFEKLEDCYFNPQEKAVQPLPQKPVHPCELEFYIPESTLTFNHKQITQLNALFHSVDYLTTDFWPHIQKLFPMLDREYGSAVDTVNLLMRLLKDKRAECEELSKQD